MFPSPFWFEKDFSGWGPGRPLYTAAISRQLHKSLPAPPGKGEGMPGRAVSLLGCPHPIPVLSQAFHVQPCHLEL